MDAHSRDRRENTAMEVNNQLRLRCGRVVAAPVESPWLTDICLNKARVTERSEDQRNLVNIGGD